ncbi:MAG: hypothetical protein IJD57_02720 [Candidatus Gastranaerophilales bacterium]|jgi:hypothetical protein|nr:hypothetical protein [Candidatus Gastranaerophilales bacterium]
MAIRILLLSLSFILVSNLVLASVGLIMGVNLYEKYGKQILNFFVGFLLFIVAVYVVCAILGLV